MVFVFRKTFSVSLLLFGITCFTTLLFGRELPSMREIMAKYGHTDKDTMHSYVESYENILEPFRKKSCNILEIGVFFGGSAYTWHEYLPYSKLFLIDINDVVLAPIKSEIDPQRWHFYIRDAYTWNTVVEIKAICEEGFDIIIDDGPHTVDSQLFALEHYLPLLKEDGVFIIEDIQSSTNLELLYKRVRQDLKLEIEIVDLRQKKGRWDDILFIVRKK